MAEKNLSENTPESQEFKVCSKCGESLPATKEYFQVRSDSGVLRGECRACAKRYKDEYYQKNKTKIIKKANKWISDNRERFNKTVRKSYYKHRDKRLEQHRKHALKVDRTEYRKEYNKINRSVMKLKRRDPVQYRGYHKQLTIEEAPRESDNGVLQCKCTYCGAYFEPTFIQVRSRIKALKGQSGGVCRLYCSDGCKKSCPIYNQNIWPKGFKRGTSREVVPALRQMALERDEYECQRCGKRIDETSLHVHHINGATQNKMISNDLWNVITLCKECHKWVHTQEGCGYNDLKCK
jgi:hypothetical protein